VELRYLKQLTQLKFSGKGRKGKNVHALWVCHCPQLQTMELSYLTALRCLRLESCDKLHTVDGLSYLQHLTTLHLRGCSVRPVCPKSLLAPCKCVSC
jgi:hypothetical protein